MMVDLTKKIKDLEDLLNNAPMLLFRTDKEGKILDFFGNATELYKPSEQFLDKLVKEVLPSNASKKILKAINKASEKEYAREEYSLIVDNQTMFYSIRVRRKNDNFICAVNNITERKLAQLEFEKTFEELNQMNKTKDKFFSIISHDLKNAFGGIFNLSQLMADNYELYSEERKIKFINEIAKTSKKTYELLENLLEWSKASKLEEHYNPVQFNLRSLVSEVQIFNEMKLLENDLTFHNMILSDNNVYADYKMSFTIMRNLVSNSIKFTPFGGKIFADSIEQTNKYEICVSDTGIGMDKTTLDNLFDITYYSKKGIRGETGSGLGLDIVKGYVERQKGTIKVESKPNVGTKVYFTLPKYLG